MEPGQRWDEKALDSSAQCRFDLLSAFSGNANIGISAKCGVSKSAKSTYSGFGPHYNCRKAFHDKHWG